MEASGGPRVAFVVVTKGLDYPTAEERRPSGARYTRDAIRGMLQFMGCKPRHAYKATQLVFQKLEKFSAEGSKFSNGSRKLWGVGTHDEASVYIAMPRSEFYELVCCTLTEYNYKYAPSSDEIKAACSLKERRRHIIVLLCGTSGSGKSTLASILANRLGISTVLSTDSIRHMMRSFTSAEETPLLFASTYEAGEALRKQQALDANRRGQQQHQQQQQALLQHPTIASNSNSQLHYQRQPPELLSASAGESEGGQRRSGLTGSLPTSAVTHPESSSAPVGVPVPGAHRHCSTGPSPTPSPSAPPPPSAHDQAIRGYKAQCELVSEHLEQLICSFEARRQSLVVEGVHLHVGLVMRLLQRHPGVVPFLVYIKNEGKHVERMAVRAKYMTLDPNKNKYVKNMRNIRWIQDYLYRKAEKHAIPCVENTNIDRSVGLIHLTLLGCLKRMMKGEQVLDAGSSTVRMLHTEYTAVVESMTWPTAAAGATGTVGCVAAAAVPSSSTVGASNSCVGLPGAGSASSLPVRAPSDSMSICPLPQPLPPAPRVLGSPRVFHTREVPSGSTLRPPSGDGSGSTGGGSNDVAGLPGGDVVASTAGSVRSSYNNPLSYSGSGGGIDLPIIPPPRASSLSGNTLLLSSSPKCSGILGQQVQQQQQQHLVSRQSQAGRRDSNTNNNTQELYPAPLVPLADWATSSPICVVPGSPRHGDSGGVGGGGGGTYGSVPAALALLSAAAAGAAADPAPGSLDSSISPRSRDLVLPAPIASTSSRAMSIPLPAFPEARTASLPLPSFPNPSTFRTSSNSQILQPLLQSTVLVQEPQTTEMGGVSRRREDQPPPQLPVDGIIASSAPAPCSGILPMPGARSGPWKSPTPPQSHPQPPKSLGRCSAGQEDQHPQGQTASMQSPHPGKDLLPGSGLHSQDIAAGRPLSPSYVLPPPAASCWLPSSSSAAAAAGEVQVCGGATSPPCSGGGHCRADSSLAVLAALKSAVCAGAATSYGGTGHACDVDVSGYSGGGNGIAGQGLDRGGLLGNGGDEMRGGSRRLSQVQMVCVDGVSGSAGQGEEQPSCEGARSPDRVLSCLQHQDQTHEEQSQQQQHHHNNHRHVLRPQSAEVSRVDAFSGVMAAGIPPATSCPEPSPPESRHANASSERIPTYNAVVEVWDGSQHDAASGAQPAIVMRTSSAAGAGDCPARTAAATAAAMATVGVADADVVHDERKAALAAAQDALSRFGDTCSDEVLHVVIKSAIFEQQMDTVTERTVRPSRFSQPPSSPPQLPLMLHPTALSSPESLSHAPHVQGDIVCYPPQAQIGFAAAGMISACQRESFAGPGAACADASQCEAAVDGAAPGPFAMDELMMRSAYGRAMSATDSATEGGLSRVSLGDLQLTPVAGSPPQEAAQPSGVAVTGLQGGGVFAGAHGWASAAAMGGAPFLCTHSRGLGGSSSPSHSGFSSDDDVGGSGPAGRGAGGAPGGTAPTRRQKSEVSPDRALSSGGLADSDDPDGEGYTGYCYGEASPLQEYGSVYESATHDDMDEHGDEDETTPLGRSNTLIRHLAGVLERNRMRASASASIAAHGGTRPAVPLPPQAHRQHHGTTPAASAGNGVRLGNLRSPHVANAQRLAGGSGAGHAASAGGGRSGTKNGESYEGSGTEGTGLNVQLRQMLQGGGSGSVSRSAAVGATSQHRGSGASKEVSLASTHRNADREAATDPASGDGQGGTAETVGDAEGNPDKQHALGPVEIREGSAATSAGARMSTPFARECG